MIEKSEGGKSQKERQRENLRDVLKYCENTVDCRRKLILHYFNEEFDSLLCNNTCDNCEAARATQTVDRTTEALSVISILKSINNKITLNQLIDIYRGSKAKIYSKYEHVPGFSAGKYLSRSEAERILQHLVIENILQEHCVTNALGFVQTYIRLNTRVANSLQKGSKKFSISEPISTKNIDNSDIYTQKTLIYQTCDHNNLKDEKHEISINFSRELNVSHSVNEICKNEDSLLINFSSEDQFSLKEKLYSNLMNLRNRLQLECKCPAPYIFTDATIIEIIETMPKSLKELEKVISLDKKKLKSYGSKILEAINS